MLKMIFLFKKNIDFRSFLKLLFNIITLLYHIDVHFLKFFNTSLKPMLETIALYFN